MSDWLKKLQKDAKATKTESPDKVFKSPSPGINYLFGKVNGMKGGYSTLLYGPAKSGKSLISLAFAGQLHREDKEAIVLHFDTEFRDNAATWKDTFGIDEKRFFQYLTNKPEEIFDYIANEVQGMIQEGAPIKMIIVDSLAMINFPKEANAEKTTNAIMGDAGAYLSRAMKAILPTIRKNKIALILCQHVRGNFDQASVMRGVKYSIPGGFALKHSVEYWMYCEKVERKDSKTFDSERLDGAGNPIQTGHSIRVRMDENSLGPQNRAVLVNLSYKDGIINQHEDIATLAINMGIVERPNNTSYVFNGKKWVGQANFMLAVRDDIDLQHELSLKIIEADLT